MTANARTVLLGLLVMALACTSVARDNMTMLSGPKHRSYGKFTSCNGTRLFSGINQNPDNWVDCLNVKSKGDESYINAVWRVYTCVLAKYKNDGTETISLMEFSEIVTSSYPDEIKKSINDLVKSLGETQGKESSWLTSKIKMTDYSGVDKIRAQYFDIEKEYCHNGTDLLVENTMSEKTWDTCSQIEEGFHRGSSCCDNNTIPLRPLTGDSPFGFFNDTHCEGTLHSILNKFYENETMKKHILQKCKFSCYLVEKSFMTIDEIQKFTGSDEGQLRQLVNATFPYIPVQMQQTIAKEMAAKHNDTIIVIVPQNVERYLERFNMTTVTEDEKAFLHSCLEIQPTRSRMKLMNLACPIQFNQTITRLMAKPE